MIASNIVGSSTPKDDIANQMMNMAKNNPPIEVVLGQNNKGKVYYNNSAILFQLQYYPFLTLIIIALFLLIAYLSFSPLERQNKTKSGQNGQRDCSSIRDSAIFFARMDSGIKRGGDKA